PSALKATLAATPRWAGAVPSAPSSFSASSRGRSSMWSRSNSQTVPSAQPLSISRFGDPGPDLIEADGRVGGAHLLPRLDHGGPLAFLLVDVAVPLEFRGADVFLGDGAFNLANGLLHVLEARLELVARLLR